MQQPLPPDFSHFEQQESAQDASLEKIRLRFRGATSELSNLEQGMLDIRKARRRIHILYQQRPV